MHRRAGASASERPTSIEVVASAGRTDCTDVSSRRPPLEPKESAEAAASAADAATTTSPGSAAATAARVSSTTAPCNIGTPSSTSSRPTPIANRAGTPCDCRISLASIPARPALERSSSRATSAPNVATDSDPSSGTKMPPWRTTASRTASRVATIAAASASRSTSACGVSVMSETRIATDRRDTFRDGAAALGDEIAASFRRIISCSAFVSVLGSSPERASISRRRLS